MPYNRLAMKITGGLPILTIVFSVFGSYLQIKALRKK